MKMLEIIDAYYPNIDGAISVAKNFTEHLNRYGTAVIAVPKAEKKLNYKDDGEIEVIRCLSGKAPEHYRAGYPMLDGKFKKKLLKADFDIIHVHSPFTMGRFGVWLGKKKKIPVVFTLHTKYKEDFKRSFHGFKPFIWVAMQYIKRVFKKADSVWTVSNKSCEVLREYGYKGDIYVMRNGTDFAYPENAQELINAVNQKHDLTGKKNVLLFVGRMALYKNIKLICDSIKICKDKGLDFTMLFVGGGFDIDKIKDYCKEIGVFDKCVFTGEVRDRDAIQGYYLRGDLFLLPSTFDMGPITKEEAAAHKTPTLLVKDTCSAERVIDNQNGYLSSNDAEIYAEKIIEICSDEKKRTEVGENAYNTLYRNWDTVAKEVIEKYHEIIDNYNKKGN